MKKYRLLKVLLLLLLHAAAFSQPGPESITGTWKGSLYVDSTKKYHPYEISISQNNGKYNGYAYLYFDNNGKSGIDVRTVKVKLKGEQVFIDDEEIIQNTYEKKPPSWIKKSMELTFSETDTGMTLKGDWSTNRTRRFLAATGSLVLVKKKDFRSTDIFKKLEELKLTSDLSYTKPSAVTEPPEAVIPPPPAAVVSVEVLRMIPERVTVSRPASRAKFKVASVQLAKKVTTPPPYVVQVPKPTPPSVVKPAAPQKPVPVAVVKTAPKPAPAAPAPAKPTPPPVAVKPAPVSKPAPPVIDAVSLQKQMEVEKRKVASTQSFYFVSDSLMLTLYDNGTVDGDTVSVLMNGQLIFAQQGLSTTAAKKTIHIPAGTDSVSLVMFAENLGSIPPNTGLLIVEDGERRYEVRFSADLSSNSKIVLRRKQDE